MENRPIQRQLPDGTYLRNGDYRIVKMIGYGGFGITYLTHHYIFGEMALKELFLNSGITYCIRESTTRQQVIPHFDPIQFIAFKQRFEEEARTLFTLRDIEGVVKVSEIFEENSTVYFSMEYLVGEKLEDYVKRKGFLVEHEGLRIIKSIGKTLDLIHRRNVLHRDIKPTNIIIGTGDKVTIIDFGIARSYIDEIAETHTTFYSPRYAPPEQKISNSRVGTYSDVYSLGATAYYVFTGKAPQSIEERTTEDFIRPAELNPKLSKRIDTAITKSLELRKEDRFQTVKEFIIALENRTETTPDSTSPDISDLSEATIIIPSKGTFDDSSREETIIISSESNQGRGNIETNDANTVIEPQNQGKKDQLKFNFKKISVLIVLLFVFGSVCVYNLLNKPLPPVDCPMITVANKEDGEKFKGEKKAIEKIMIGTWKTQDQISLKIKADKSCDLQSKQGTWSIHPMRKGIYISLKFAGDTSILWKAVLIEKIKPQKSFDIIHCDKDESLVFTRQ